MQHLDEGLIHAWLDGALTDEEARHAEAHIASCEACRAAVAEARGLIAASSMILSKLDVDAAGATRTAAPGTAPGPDSTETLRPIAAARFPVKRPLAAYRLRAAAAVLVLAGGVAAVGQLTSGDDIGRVVDGAATESSVLAAPEQVAAGDATVVPTDTPAPLPPPPTVEPAPHLPRPQAAARSGEVGRGTVVPPREAGQDARPTIGQAADHGAATGSLPGEVSGQLAGVVLPTVPAAPAPTTAAAAEEDLSAVSARESAEQLRRQEATLAQGARAAMAPPAASDAPASSALRPTEPTVARAAVAVKPVAPRCYALSLSPWRPAGAAAPLQPPERIVLSADTGTVGAARGQRLVRPMGDLEDRYQAAWWTEVHPTTLILTWAAGGEGIVMRLVRSDDAVHGTARTFGTRDGIERAAEVSGRLIDCGSAR